MNGTPQGDASASYIHYDTSSQTYVQKYVYCSGPNYANILSLNRGNGKSSINVTLDPSRPDCSGPPGFIVTLSLSGTADGVFMESTSGSGRSQYMDTSYKYNDQSDTFTEEFTGTSGQYTGDVTGYVPAFRNSDITKVKRSEQGEVVEPASDGPIAGFSIRRWSMAERQAVRARRPLHAR